MDGHQDVLVVVPRGTSRLFRGLADGFFVPAGPESGLDLDGRVAGAEWPDLDLDGRIDVMLTLEEDTRLHRGDGSETCSKVDIGATAGPAGAFNAGPVDMGGLCGLLAGRARAGHLHRRLDHPYTLGMLAPLSQDFS